jgi:hypothetical protein
MLFIPFLVTNNHQTEAQWIEPALTCFRRLNAVQ